MRAPATAIVLALGAVCSRTSAQDECAGTMFGPSLEITTALDVPVSLSSGDIDGDGDLDVVGAVWLEGEVRWWENLNGTAMSWREHLVEDQLDGPRDIALADLDGDGDPDIAGVIAGLANLVHVLWWENDGGAWLRHEVDDAFAGAHGIRAADFDGDGLIDLAAVAYTDDAVAWWENGGNGMTWQRHDVARGFDAAFSISSADLDADGDEDIVATANAGDRVAWWENLDGRGEQWKEHDIALQYDGAAGISAADLDGDGDIDVLSTAEFDGEFTWWENPDGRAGRWIRHALWAEADGALTITHADLDGDGDLDVAGAALFPDEALHWWENLDGAGEVWMQHPLDESMTWGIALIPADLDGDGDRDLLGGLYDAGASGLLGWWRNVAACCTDFVPEGGDGATGPADLAALLDGWGPNPGHAADFNADGVIGPADLAVLLDHWGPCPSAFTKQ